MPVDVRYFISRPQTQVSIKLEPDNLADVVAELANYTSIPITVTSGGIEWLQGTSGAGSATVGQYVMCASSGMGGLGGGDEDPSENVWIQEVAARDVDYVVNEES
jgi:hypothetical protein